MDLKAVDLSEQALQGIGLVLTPRQRQAVTGGAEYDYLQTNESLGLEAPLSSGSLECSPRPMRLTRMERHLNTRELLVALDGDATVCLAPPQEASGGMLHGITAVKLRAGDVVILERGAWHWIPYPNAKRPVRFLVIFRSATGQDDLHYCDLAQERVVRG